MNQIVSVSRALCAFLLAVGTGACAPGGRDAASPSPSPALEQGWVHACSITNDPVDMAVCQEKIALAYVRRGDAGRALELGRRIDSWQKGLVLAEAAALLAERGRVEASQALVAEAREAAKPIEDWMHDWIVVRIARAEAFLGLEDAIHRARVRYGENRDYLAQVAGCEALLRARQGRVDDALAILQALADADYFDIATGRAEGYVLVADKGKLQKADALRVLDLGAEAALKVKGYRKHELALDLVDARLRHGDAAGAREQLERTTEAIAASRYPGHIRTPLMAGAALRWGRLGERGRVEALQKDAEPLIEADTLDIERPSIHALFAEAWAAAGDRARALEDYGRAMKLASELANPRPRAKALVDIGLSLARSGIEEPSLVEMLHPRGAVSHGAKT